MVLLYFIRPDQGGFITDQLGNAVHLLEPFDFFIGNGKSKPAAAMPRHGLAGELFQPGIEQGAFMVDLGKIQRSGEMRALPGSVPGGA